MDYSFDMFKSKKTISLTTSYKYEYVGLYYNAYSNDGIHFHMSIKDKESLLARISFYHKFFCKDIRFDSVYHSITNETNYQLKYCMGLPLEMYKTADNIETIVSNINFEYGLEDDLKVFSTCNDITNAFYEDNSSSFLLNYLVTHGIFCFNPEVFFAFGEDKRDVFPVYIDEDKIPQNLRLESIEELFIDFMENPLALTPKEYLEKFKPLEKQSMQQLLEYAYYNKDNSNVDFNIKQCISNYILNVFTSIVNNCIKENNIAITPFTDSVLNHDISYSDCELQYAYIGHNFAAYDISPLRIEKIDEKNKIVFNHHYDHYLAGDFDNIVLAFNAVKKYFDLNLNYQYMPMVFIKLMGLPYPSFKKMKYYDFENGNGKDFTTQLYGEIALTGDFNKCNIMPLTISEEGLINTYPFDNNLDCAALFFRKLYSKKIFLSNCNAISLDPDIPFILFSKNKIRDKNLVKWMNGDSLDFSTFIKEVEKDKDNSEYDIEQLNHFYCEDNENGQMRSIHKFFDGLLNGLDSNQAYDAIDNCYLQKEEFINMVWNFFNYYFTKFYSKNNEMDSSAMYFSSCMFSESSLINVPQFPCVCGYLGRNFLCFLKDEHLVLDSLDRTAFHNLEAIYDEQQKKNKTIFFSIKYGDTTSCYPLEIYDETILKMIFLGLPLQLYFLFKRDDSSFESQIVFLDNVSPLYLDEYKDLLNQEPFLKYRIKADLLREKIYDTGNLNVGFLTLDNLKGSKYSGFFERENYISCLNELKDKSNEENSLINKHIDSLNIFKKIQKAALGKASFLQVNSLPKYYPYYQLRVLNKIQSIERDEIDTPNFGSVYYWPTMTYTKDDKTIYISLSTSFFVYSFNKEKGEFFISENDADGIQRLIMYYLYQNEYDVNTDFDTYMKKMFVACGFASVLSAQFYSYMNKMKDDLYSFDVRDCFTFKDYDLLPELPILKVTSSFSFEYFNNSNVKDSIQVNNYFLRNGLISLSGLYSQEFKNAFIILPTGLVKDYFLPDMMTYSQILNICFNQLSWDRAICVYAEKLMNYLYEQNKEILLNLFNYEYAFNVEGDLALKSYILKGQKDFPLKDDKYEKSDELIALITDVIHEAFELLRNRVIKRVLI